MIKKFQIRLSVCLLVFLYKTHLDLDFIFFVAEIFYLLRQYLSVDII